MLKLNLLPPKQKETFEWEKNRRLAIFSSGVFSLFLLLFGGLLFSGVVYNRIQLEPFVEAIRREEVREETQRAENLESNTRAFVKKLQNVRQIQEERDDYEVVLRELALVPLSGVVFSSVAIREEFSGKDTVQIARIEGHADTRDQVIAMEDTIKQHARFADLVSPFSNKNQEKDINFTFTFRVLGP